MALRKSAIQKTKKAGSENEGVVKMKLRVNT
jgi:hypothetical protein